MIVRTLILGLALWLTGASQLVAGTPPDRLWSGNGIVQESLPFLPGVKYATVHRAVAGEYQFLHGPAVISYRGKLYASWANSPVDENSAAEVLRYGVSSDHGVTWSEPGFIARGEPGEVSYSHGSFLVDEGTLWALAACYRGAATDGKAGATFPSLRMEAFEYSEESRSWKSGGVLAEGFWPLDEPKRLPHGAWVVGGLDAWERPVVAISERDHVLRPWKVMTIPAAVEPRLRFAETSVIAYGELLLAIVRNTQSPNALVSCSEDGGHTWSPLEKSLYPMGTAKPGAGLLSTGQPFLVSNLFRGRNLLTLAVGRPGSKKLDRVWKLKDGVSPQPYFPGRAKSPQWSYPYAHEYEGNLYIVYSVGKEDCELAVVPLAELGETPSEN